MKKIYYEQHGTGEDLILIGGFTADHSIWTSMIGYLSRHFRVLVLDNPGVGRSFTPEVDYSIELMSKDIILLLDYLGIQRANFIGHSMGAALLLQICLNEPDRVFKAVLCGGMATVPITAKLQIQALQHSLKNEFANDYISLSIMPWIFGRRFLNDPKRVEKFQKKRTENKYPQTLAGLEAQVQALLSYNISSRLNEIKTNCLIIAAEEDLLIPTHCAEFLHKNLQHSRLEMLGEGIGHMFHVEEPYQLSQIILRSFEKNYV